ncbi:MAG: response regulator transcription factor [Xanthobacteraceae bacterium]
MRLLIIEDDRDAADYLVKAFREVGHVADQATDGEEGQALALDGQYDVLIVDRMLPKLDGLSVIAALRALARRPGKRGEETVYRVADLELNRLSHEVSRAGQELQLQPREFRLLEYLMRHAGQVVTRTMLLENVWDYHFDPQTNVIDVHISRLRSKIDKGFSQPLLHTVRGAGYMIRDGAR